MIPVVNWMMYVVSYRYLLRVCFGVMGLVVITKDFHKRTLSARVSYFNNLNFIIAFFYF